MDLASIRADIARELPVRVKPLLLAFYGMKARLEDGSVVIGDDEEGYASSSRPGFIDARRPRIRSIPRVSAGRSRDRAGARLRGTNAPTRVRLRFDRRGRQIAVDDGTPTASQRRSPRWDEERTGLAQCAGTRRLGTVRQQRQDRHAQRAEHQTVGAALALIPTLLARHPAAERRVDRRLRQPDQEAEAEKAGRSPVHGRPSPPKLPGRTPRPGPESDGSYQSR